MLISSYRKLIKTSENNIINFAIKKEDIGHIQENAFNRAVWRKPYAKVLRQRFTNFLSSWGLSKLSDFFIVFLSQKKYLIFQFIK